MIPGIRTALNEHVEQNKLSATELANAIGISRAHVSRILNGGNASTKVWRKLLNHCNLTIEVAPMPGAGGRLFNEDTKPNGQQIHHDLTRVHNFIDATIPDLKEDAPTLTLEELERRVQALENELHQSEDRLRLAKEAPRLSESEPWHSAQEGSVWDVSINGAAPLRMIVGPGKVFYDVLVDVRGQVPYSIKCSTITSAVKIFDAPRLRR